MGYKGLNQHKDKLTLERKTSHEYADRQIWGEKQSKSEKKNKTMGALEEMDEIILVLHGPAALHVCGGVAS